MPSGAKKRKAAKKKKESGANINPSTNSSQGNEDVKNQDDKGSDSSGLSSPASQNHPSHNNSFGEENKEIQESSSSVAGVLGDAETTQKLGLATERKNGIVQNQSAKGSYDDDHSSSSSDDESVDTTKKPEADEKVLAEKIYDLSAPTAASIVYSITPEVAASEETISIAESAAVENTAIPDMIASEKLEARLPTNGVVSVAYPRDQSSKQNEDRDLHLTAHVKDSENPEHSKSESEEQPLIGSVAQVPVPQRRTSWLSCCGLCDVFTGSNR